MFNQMLNLINKNTDPFELRIGDFSMAQANWDFPPSAFLTVFISNWEKNRERINDLAEIDFARKIIINKKNSGVWEKSILFENQNNFDNDSIVEEEFRDRIRGFNDQELISKTEHYKDRISSNLADIQPIIDFLKNKLTQLSRKDRGKHLYWSSELNNLVQVIAVS